MVIGNANKCFPLRCTVQNKCVSFTHHIAIFAIKENATYRSTDK